MLKDNAVGKHSAILNNILETIGQTPLIRLHRSVEHLAPTICTKVEYFNPGGSTKDRVALNMILAAEHSGALKPGGMIIEATEIQSSDTGVLLEAGFGRVGVSRLSPREICEFSLRITPSSEL
jgi:cysteine synthase